MAKRKREATHFHIAGWERPESNYFKIPNAFTDVMAQISNLAELKVVVYILRHTWGFQEFGIAKKITTDEFMHGRWLADGTRMDAGTGLSKQAVIDGLSSAVEHGLIEEETDASDRGRIKKFYKLKMIADARGLDGKIPVVDNLEVDVNNLDIRVNKVDSRGLNDRHRTQKETIERNLQKENNSNFEGSTPRRRNGAKTAAPSAPDTEEPFSEDIAALMDDLTKQVLHDVEHLHSNVSQGMNLWRKSKLSEDDFIDLLYAAKKVTLEHTGSIRKRAGFAGLKNRAPYFFKVLKTLIEDKRRENLLAQARNIGHGPVIG